MKNTRYRRSGGALLLIGIGLLRSGGFVPKWVGVVTVAGALLLAVPLPEAPVLTGPQVEPARGLMVATIGLGMIRAAAAVTPVRENKILMEV